MKALYRDRVTIHRSTPTYTTGRMAVGLASSSTDVHCNIQEKRGNVQTGDSGQSLTYDAFAYFPRSTDIKPQSADDQSDIIEQTFPTTGNKFLVLFVGQKHGRRTRCGKLTAYLKRVMKKL